MSAPLKIATFFVTFVGPLCDFLGGSLRQSSSAPRISSILRAAGRTSKVNYLTQSSTSARLVSASVQRQRTSRVLNDQAYFMGLSYGDITGCGIFLLGLLMIGKMLGIQSMLWALALTIGLLCLLVPIRMRFRRKILRDSLIYLSSKGTRRLR